MKMSDLDNYTNANLDEVKYKIHEIDVAIEKLPYFSSRQKRAELGTKKEELVDQVIDLMTVQYIDVLNNQLSIKAAIRKEQDYVESQQIINELDRQIVGNKAAEIARFEKLARDVLLTAINEREKNEDYIIDQHKSGVISENVMNKTLEQYDIVANQCIKIVQDMMALSLNKQQKILKKTMNVVNYQNKKDPHEKAYLKKVVTAEKTADKKALSLEKKKKQQTELYEQQKKQLEQLKNELEEEESSLQAKELLLRKEQTSLDEREQKIAGLEGKERAKAKQFVNSQKQEASNIKNNILAEARENKSKIIKEGKKEKQRIIDQAASKKEAISKIVRSLSEQTTFYDFQKALTKKCDMTDALTNDDKEELASICYSIKSVLERTESDIPGFLNTVSVSPDTYRMNQVKVVLERLAKEITNIKNSDKLDADERDALLMQWEEYREKELAMIMDS